MTLYVCAGIPMNENLTHQSCKLDNGVGEGFMIFAFIIAFLFIGVLFYSLYREKKNGGYIEIGWP
jgi:hypothetical protein